MEGELTNILSRGWLHTLFCDEAEGRLQYPSPVIQILQVRSIKSDTGQERVRLVVSDGDYFCQGMVATQSHHLIADNQLEASKIARIKDYQKNVIKDKAILIILDLEPLTQYAVSGKIGTPQALPPIPELQPISGTGFYGAAKQDASTASAMAKPAPARRPMDARAANIYPIEAISPYANKWTIKARVTVKTPIKTWKKANNNEGKLFSVNFLDESSEIRATAFNDAVDMFYDVLQEGEVYYISHSASTSVVKPAKKQFSNLSHDYEITLENSIKIEKAEDQSSVPNVRFNFCNLGELRDVEKDSTVDVIGVLKQVDEVQSITSKTTNKPYEKRELVIVDDSEYQVRVTIWGQTAQSFDAMPESVVAFKGVKVSDFGGKSLSLLSSGTMAINPDIGDAHRLKGWYDSQGRTADHFNTHSNLASVGNATGRANDSKTISEVKDLQLGMDDKPTYFSLSATVVFIKQDSFCYPACASDACNKKMTEISDGLWRCEHCNKNFPAPQYRYVMQINVCDHTGQLWLSCFDDTGRLIMGASADELMSFKAQSDGELSADPVPAFENANCRRYNFRVRAKMETFQEQERVRYQVMNATPLDWKSEGHKLAELIKQYNFNG